MLKRKASLKRMPLARKPARAHRGTSASNPDRVAWKTSGAGYCAACEAFTMHLERHHVIERQTLVREHREDLEWDLRNAMLVCPDCHAQHTSAFRRIPASRIPDVALAFAADFFGSEARAADYIQRMYGLGRRRGL